MGIRITKSAMLTLMERNIKKGLLSVIDYRKCWKGLLGVLEVVEKLDGRKKKKLLNHNIDKSRINDNRWQKKSQEKLL